MNDRQLRYVLAVANTRSISAAARQLFISQPSLSAMIASIEEDLGAPLFDRTTTPLSLTYAGKCYVEAAGQILAIERDLRRKVTESSESVQGPLSVGCSSATSSVIMTFLIPKFLKLYPEVRLQIIEDHATDLGRYLSSGEADVLCCPTLSEEENYEKSILSHEDMILLAPKSFVPGTLQSLSGKPFPSFDFACLSGKPFALMKTGHMTRELQEEVLRREQIVPEILLETERWETCVSMVENDLAFTLLPFNKLKQDVVLGGLCAYSVHADVYREVCLYWRRNSLLPRVTETFLRFAEEEFRKLG